MPISQRRKCLFDGDWRVIGEPPETYTLQLARWLKGFSVIKWCCKVHLPKSDRVSLRQHLFDGKLKCIVQPAVLQEIILSTLLKTLMNDWKLLILLRRNLSYHHRSDMPQQCKISNEIQWNECNWVSFILRLKVTEENNSRAIPLTESFF